MTNTFQLNWLNIICMLFFFSIWSCERENKKNQDQRCPDVQAVEFDKKLCFERLKLPEPLESNRSLIFYLDSLQENYTNNLPESDSLEKLTKVILALETFSVDQYKWAASNLYLLRATFLYEIADYNQMLDDASKAATLLEEYGIQDDCTWAYSAFAHNMTGLAYLGLDDFDNAINNMETSFSLYHKVGLDDQGVANYINLGLAFSQAGMAEEALKWYGKADCIFNNLPPSKIDSSEYFKFFNNYAHAYDVQSQRSKEVGELHSSNECLNLSLEYRKKGIDWVGDRIWSEKFIETTLISFLNKAFTFSIFPEFHGAPDSTRLYAGKCFEKIGHAQPYLQTLIKAIGLRHLAYASAMESNDKKALNFINMAIDTVDSNTPNLIAYKRYYSDFLFAKGDVLKMCADKQTGNILLLQKSLDAYLIAMDFLDEYRKEFATDKSLELFFRPRLRFFSEAFGVAYELFKKKRDNSYLDIDFQIAERSKSYTLRQGIFKQLETWKKGGQLSGLAEQERNYIDTIRNHEVSLLNNPNDSEVQKLLRIAKEDFASFIRRLSESNNQTERSYFLNRFDNSIPSIEEVQEWIPDSQTAVIEYQLGIKKGWAVVITSQESSVTEFPIDSAFHALVRQYVEYFKSDKGFFKKTSRDLYQHIFQPLESRIGAEIKNLLIIPDGKLSEVSFEGLLRKPPKNEPRNKLPYLLDKYSINYHYSIAGLLGLKNLESLKPKAKSTFAGFIAKVAPEFSCGYSKLDSLRNMTIRMGARFQKGGTKNIFEHATIDDFKNNGGKYRINQLTMHGCAAEENGQVFYLEFYDKKNGGSSQLTIPEVYNLSIKNDLTVLSNCQTAQGSLVPGEGVISLARAFAYAGCPAIIAMKSDGSDQSTAEILEYFYGNLEAGQPVALALSEAKRTFFKKQEEHPWKWSNLVFIGDPSMESPFLLQ